MTSNSVLLKLTTTTLTSTGRCTNGRQAGDNCENEVAGWMRVDHGGLDDRGSV